MSQEEEAGSVANCEVQLNISKKKFVELKHDREFEKFSWPYLGFKSMEILSSKIENGIKYEELKQIPLTTPSIIQWYLGKEDFDFVMKEKMRLSDESSSFSIIPPIMESYININGSLDIDEIDSEACKLKLKTAIKMNFWGGGFIEGKVVEKLNKAIEVWPKIIEDWMKLKGISKFDE